MDPNPGVAETGRRALEAGRDEPLPNGPGNWCTLANDAPDGYDFSSACKAHDECYENLYKTKEECDKEFYRDMLAICKANYNDAALCRWYAQRYAYAVATSSRAQDAWEEAQENARELLQGEGKPSCPNP